MKKLVSIVLPIMLFMVGVSGVNAATIKVNKVEIGTEKAIKGATMTLSKPKPGSALGDVIKTWTTDGSVEEITVDPGRYMLVENEPAPGYVTAKDVEIIITDQDQVYELTSESDYTKAEFNAIDAKTKKHISGVKFELRNSKNQVVDSWTSNGTTHKKNYLPIDTYTLKILAVPEGYQLVGDQTIIIDELCYTAKVTQIQFPEKPNPTPTPTPTPTPKPTPTPTPGEPTPTPTPTPDEITDVPDTMMNNSSIFGLVGLAVIALGSGLIYKHAKNN